MSSYIYRTAQPLGLFFYKLLGHLSNDLMPPKIEYIMSIYLVVLRKNNNKKSKALA